MINTTQAKAAGGRLKKPLVLIVWLVALLSTVWIGDLHAFSTALKYSTEDQGRREILSFHLPPGAPRPRMELVDLQTLRLTILDVLALPANTLDPERSRWISSFKVDEIPSGEAGITVFLGLKKPNLSFRDSLGDTDPITGTPYRMEIDQLPPPSSEKETKILEGRILPGRDGTLVVISRTGSGSVEPSVELEAHVARLRWQDAVLAPSWRPVDPAGLAARLLAYDFSRNQVDMEITLDPTVTTVDFHHDNAAGLFIVELATKNSLGRGANATEILKQRKDSLSSGVVQPLNRLDPIFLPRPDVSLRLQDKDVDESYFMNTAREAAKDRQYARSRAYMGRLLQLFPDTPNRELIETMQWDLANNMKWKAGWLLAELNQLLARYPNMIRYPHYRLAQLHLLNRAARYEEATAMMWDPNLPKDRPEVWIERGYAAMGMAHSSSEENENWQAAVDHLNRALELTHDHGKLSAEAHYLLARMAQERHTDNGREAIRLLDALSPEQIAFIANRPDWLMAVGDIYYENRLYPKAFQYYSRFISNYPEVKDIMPFALMRAAESSREMGERRDAERLFDTLQKHYPESEGAAWGRVFRLRMDKSTDVEARLQKLDDVIKTLALPDVLSAGLRIKAEMQGDAHRYHQALRTLNNLLSLSSRDREVAHAKKLKRDYLIAGMQDSLAADHPEQAIQLAELHGDDWRADPSFVPARMALAEALLRIGVWKEGLNMLNGISAPEVAGLTQLAQAFAAGQWPEVAVAPIAPFDPTTAPSAGKKGDDNQAHGGAETALAAIEEGTPSVGRGVPNAVGSPLPATEEETPTVKNTLPGTEKTPVGMVTVAEARVRLDQATRLEESSEWMGIINLLEQLPSNLLNATSQNKRLLLLAKAEAGRNRFPQAVGYMETLASGREVGDGADYYWYATLLQQWKGDSKALPIFTRTSKEASNPEIQALACIRIGDIMQKSGDFAAAIGQYREAARLAPATPWAKVASENASQLEMAMEVAQ